MPLPLAVISCVLPHELEGGRGVVPRVMPNSAAAERGVYHVQGTLGLKEGGERWN